MKFPFRIRNRGGRRRPIATEDVAATLATLRRPRHDELRFGMLLAGEALLQPLDPDAEAPQPEDGAAADEAEPGAGDAPQQLLPDLHEAAAAPTAEEDDAAAALPEAAAPPPAPPAAVGEPAAMPAVEASAVSTGSLPLQAAALPPTIVTVVSATVTATTTATTPVTPPSPPVVEDPQIVDEPVVEAVGDGGATVVAPTVTPATVPAPVSAPPEPGGGGGGTTVETPLPPGIYVDIDQDIASASSVGVSADVDGDFTQSASGTQSGPATSCEVEYQAGDDGLPESLWWAGWQTVIYRIDIVQIETWLQDIDVDIDDTGAGEGVRVLVDQDTWINQTAAIAIAAHAEGAVLTVTTHATIITEIIQYTQVIVQLGHIQGSSDELPLLPATADGALESDQDDGAPSPVEVVVEQSVVITQAVTVTTDIQEGLELHLDAVLGQIGGVLQQVDVSVELEEDEDGDEATIVVDADQSADLQQELEVSVEVDDASGTLLTADDDDEDEAGEEDEQPVAEADDGVAALMDAAFAEGEDVDFDTAFDSGPDAELAEEDEDDSRTASPTAAASDAANDDEDTGIAVDVDSDDDNQHLAAQ